MVLFCQTGVDSTIGIDEDTAMVTLFQNESSLGLNSAQVTSFVDYRIKVFLLGTVCVYLVVEFVQKTSFKTVFFTFIGCRSEANREHLVRLEILAESIYISETSVVTLVDQHDASLSGVLALQVCLEVHSVSILVTCTDKKFSK